MLEKQIISVIDATSTKSDFLLVDDSFEKTASVDTDPVIAEFVQKLTKQQNVIYALINALTASDYISSNLNGDWISEDVLKNYYKTFEENGHVYFHHVNKDPNKAVGRVIFSHYNPKMHRVELVVKIFTDRPDSANLIKRINSNDYIATSMGLKTSYDVCSICNKKSKTRAEYCEHLKTQMNSILPDGRKVFANNPEAKFFDISIVRVPADPTSAIMKILTNLSDSKEIAQPSENIFDNLFKVSYIKEANLKSAELKKFISTKLEVVQTSENPEKLLNSQGKLNNDVIEKLSEYSISDILSTFLGLRILPTPQDFQKIALFSSGEKELALKLESENSVFDYKTVPDEVLVSSEVDLNKFSYNIYEILQDDIHDHTWVKEAAIARELVKVAEDALRPGEIKEPSMIRKLLFSTEDRKSVV